MKIYSQLYYPNIFIPNVKNKYSRFVINKSIKLMNNNDKEYVKSNLAKVQISSSKEKNKLKSFLGKI